LVLASSFFYFTSEQALEERYGSDGFPKHGMGLLLATLSKMFDSFQEAYKGQLSWLFEITS
jgi:hypothetical protein